MTRWAAPKFILGESYGGMRTAGVAYELLNKHNVALNGVVLVSPYLDFGSGSAGLSLTDGDVNYLSTYAATAWYHKRLSARLQADLRATLREAEAFAQGEYASALMRGSALPAEDRARIVGRLAELTGLSETWIDRADLRIEIHRFCK